MESISRSVGQSSPFKEGSAFSKKSWGDNFRDFLIANKIDTLIYCNYGYLSNLLTISSPGYTVRVMVLIDGNEGISLSDVLTIPTPLNPNPVIVRDTISDFLAEAGRQLTGIEKQPRCLIYRIGSEWKACNEPMDAFLTRNLELPSNPYEYPKHILTDEEFHQIYLQLVRCSKNEEKKRQQKLRAQFDKFCSNINQQLAKKFYSDVDVEAYVKLVDKKGRVVYENTLKSNYKNKRSPVRLNITLGPDGSIKIDHDYSADYLKELEDRWIEEARKRGLSVDVPAMRQDVIDYFNSEEAELGFGKKFLREIRTWFDADVGNYIEAIQATSKVTEHVWEEGVLNESLWQSADQEHKNWPTYMRMNAGVAGVADGAIDEILGIPMTVKTVYQIATDDEKREQIGKIFTKEGFTSLVEGMIADTKEVLNDPEKKQHFVGKTIVSSFTMIAGVGAVNKAGKVDDLMEAADGALDAAGKLDSPDLTTFIDQTRKQGRGVEADDLGRRLIGEIGEDELIERLPEIHDIARKKKIKPSWEEVEKFFKRGNDYNKKVNARIPPKYKYNEVTVNAINRDGTPLMRNGKQVKYRVDGYQPGKSIVSRKATDFDSIETSTFETYLTELKRKYPQGSEITAPKYRDIVKDEGNAGRYLQGDLVLEVPASNLKSPKYAKFTKLAEKYNIKLVTESE